MISRLSVMMRPLRYLFMKSHKLTIKSPTFIVMSANFILFNIFISWSYYNKINKVDLAVANKNYQENLQDKDVRKQRKLSTEQSQSEENQKKKTDNLFKIPQDVRKCINKSKMILVMDLDQTMVFTRRKKEPKHQNFQKIVCGDNITYVEFRPHIGEFLQAVSQLFTIYVYTAGTQAYADPVLELLPNSKVISKRFYRESCIVHKGNLIKDLKVIKKQLSSAAVQKQKQKQKVTILVDDNGLSISYNHPHAVRIRAFEGNQQDRYLQQIFLKLLQYYRQHCSHRAGSSRTFGHGINLGGGQGHGKTEAKTQPAAHANTSNQTRGQSQGDHNKAGRY